MSMRLQGIVDLSQNRKATDQDVDRCQALWDQIAAADNMGQDQWVSPDGHRVYGQISDIGSRSQVTRDFLDALRFDSYMFSGWRLANLLSQNMMPSWLDALRDQFTSDDLTDWCIPAFAKYARDLPSDFICDAPLVCGEIGYRVGRYCVNQDIVSYQERVWALHSKRCFFPTL
jgi:hypothetical protein